MVSLWEDLLYQAVNPELVDKWLEQHRKEKEIVWLLSKEKSLLTLDSIDYHPEDKSFLYYQRFSGKEIMGFLGSSNLKHSGIVSCAVFSSDGRYILSGSSDSTLKLWEVETGKEIHTFKGHKLSVNSVCFSPDGIYILSGSSDSTLKLWGVESGKKWHTFKGHSKKVWSVAFAANGKAIISCSQDHTIKIWDILTGKCLKTLDLLWIPVEIKEIPSKPGLFASANANGTVTLFDFREILNKSVNK